MVSSKISSTTVYVTLKSEDWSNNRNHRNKICLKYNVGGGGAGLYWGF